MVFNKRFNFDVLKKTSEATKLFIEIYGNITVYIDKKA